MQTNLMTAQNAFFFIFSFTGFGFGRAYLSLSDKG